jgi:hypothetical protein
MNKDGNYATLEIENPFSLPKIAGHYLLTWPIESLKAYLAELPHWDGHFGKTSISLASKDRNHLDWIKTGNRLIGIGGNIQKAKLSGFGTVMYGLQYNNRLFANLSSVKEQYIIWEKNRVFCPTVPSGAFYIRRKEKISVTGNSNYLGQPYTIATEIKVPPKLVQDFQTAYFKAFPCIKKMHLWVAKELQTKGYLVNVFGRRRDFFDRPDSNETLKQAVAFLLQSATADDMNLGLWRIWKYIPDRAQLLLQLHDANYFQFNIDDNEIDLIKTAQKLLDVELICGQRHFIVPTDPLTGFNLGHRYKLDEFGKPKEVNPMGLDKIGNPRKEISKIRSIPK